MEIVKYACLGINFIVVSEEAHEYNLPSLAKVLCRRQGASADGLVVVSPGPPGRRNLELYNSRGIRVQPGGGALRAAGSWLGDGSWELDFGSGVQRVDVNGPITTLWYPRPILGGEYQIGRDYHGYLVSLLHRYFVTFVEDDDFDPSIQGEALERYFGGLGEVVFLLERDETVGSRIWKHGQGELPGSGGGACAAAAVLWKLGRLPEPLEMLMPGGSAKISMDRDGRFVQEIQVNRILSAQLDKGLLGEMKN